MNDIKNQIAFTMRIRQEISDRTTPTTCQETRALTVHASYDKIWEITNCINDAIYDFF